MSINNCYIIKEHDGRWYGWDEMAERSTMDKPDRILYYEDANFTASTQKELISKMEDSYYLSPEYGYHTDSLPKDGTKIKFLSRNLLNKKEKL